MVKFQKLTTTGYCGNAFSAGSAVAPLADCSFPCAGNSAETCGAGNRLSVYKNTGTAPASSSTSTPPVTTQPSGPGPQKTGLPSGWTYYGCQTEATNARALASKSTAYDTMTLESCASDCAGFTYFGSEYGRECE